MNGALMVVATIPVSDLERARTFYADALGLRKSGGTAIVGGATVQPGSLAATVFRPAGAFVASVARAARAASSCARYGRAPTRSKIA